MASEKERMEKAEEAAWEAAYNLREVNRQRDYEERAKTVESNIVPPAVDKDHMTSGGGGVHQDQQPGVFGSMFRAVAETVGHARDAVAGKGHEVADKTSSAAETVAETAGETKEAAKEKARKTKDYTAETANQAAEKAGEIKDSAKEKANQAAEKAGEVKDTAKGKAEEYKNSAAEKARETKDYTAEKANEVAEKAKETKDYTAEKAKEGTETAGNKLGGVARMAMDFFSGKKDNEEKTDDNNATRVTQPMMEERRKEAGEETRRRVEELKLQDEAEKADYQHRKEEAERGKAARDNMYGGMGLGTIVESVKSKLTKPAGVVEETVASREHDGTGRVRVDSRKEQEEGGKIPLEKTRPGAVAATLKAADQMTGQTFNDVGRMGDEGVVHVEEAEEVVRRKGK